VAIVDTQKLQFDIQEIPEGASSKTAHLPGDYFPLDDEATLINADVEITFYRTDHFIKVSFSLTADVELICDRCLESFTEKVNGSFDILFQPGDVVESDTVQSAVRQIPADDLIIDINEEVRDTVMLNVPVKKIHPKYIDEDGKPTEYETARFGDIPDEDEEKIDPRWEKLKKLK